MSQNQLQMHYLILPAGKLKGMTESRWGNCLGCKEGLVRIVDKVQMISSVNLTESGIEANLDGVESHLECLKCGWKDGDDKGVFNA